MSDNKTIQTGIRISTELHEWIKEYAKKDKRSANFAFNEALEFFRKHKEKEQQHRNTDK